MIFFKTLLEFLFYPNIDGGNVRIGFVDTLVTYDDNNGVQSNVILE
jgi:hypothetical protein